MEKSMAEATENVEKDLKNNEPDFHKEWGILSVKNCFAARDAIRNGGDVSLCSTEKTTEDKIIKGEEIQAWGLNVDSLLVKDEAELYAREIL